jgi:hypothetical protein
MSAYLLRLRPDVPLPGALSDGWARRDPHGPRRLALASIGAALADTVHALILWRVVQASVGAGMVVGRAMIRPLQYSAQRLHVARDAVLRLAPAIAPSSADGSSLASAGARSSGSSLRRVHPRRRQLALAPRDAPRGAASRSIQWRCGAVTSRHPPTAPLLSLAVGSSTPSSYI